MEAKDTVMSYESVEQMQHTTEAVWVDKGRNIAETQAEITGKIMYDEGFKAGYFEGRGLGIRDGIREVVEWVTETFYHPEFIGKIKPETMLQMVKLWQAKLKEWGIK